MIQRHCAFSAAVLLCLVTLSGCGYHFVGTGKLPENIESVYIRKLENQTRETGLENQLTDQLIVAFSRGNAVVSKNEDTADAVLSGVITRMNEGTVSKTQQERRITVWVDLTLKAGEGKTVWTGKGISDSRIYTTGSGSGSSETREESVRLMCEKVAEVAYQRMTNDF